MGGEKKDALLASKIYKSVNANCNLNVSAGIKVLKVCSSLRDKNPRRAAGDMLLVFMGSNQGSKNLVSCPKLDTDSLRDLGMTAASNRSIDKETSQKWSDFIGGEQACIALGSEGSVST